MKITFVNGGFALDHFAATGSLSKLPESSMESLVDSAEKGRQSKLGRLEMMCSMVGWDYTTPSGRYQALGPK